jgi:hypothetical protein
MECRMYALLDTHVLIWLDQDHPSLGAEARKRADLALQQGRLAVSAISFWEITMQIVKGRITLALPSTLPVGDDGNANRWRVIKQGFSKALPMTERRSAVRVARGERGIWQSFRVLLTLLTYIHVGNAAFGNMWFGMMRIIRHMSIIATSTPLSMAWSNRFQIGLIQLFTAMLGRGFTRLVGNVPKYWYCRR